MTLEAKCRELERLAEEIMRDTGSFGIGFARLPGEFQFQVTKIQLEAMFPGMEFDTGEPREDGYIEKYAYVGPVKFFCLYSEGDLQRIVRQLKNLSAEARAKVLEAIGKESEWQCGQLS